MTSGFGFDPGFRWTGFIDRGEPLADDALKTKLADRRKHFSTIALGVFDVLDGPRALSSGFKVLQPRRIETQFMGALLPKFDIVSPFRKPGGSSMRKLLVTVAGLIALSAHAMAQNAPQTQQMPRGKPSLNLMGEKQVDPRVQAYRKAIDGEYESALKKIPEHKKKNSDPWEGVRPGGPTKK